MWTIPAEQFRLTHLFVSNEETRFYLKGVYVEPVKSGAVLASTDGTRLVAFNCPDAAADGPAIIKAPKELIAAIKRFARPNRSGEKPTAYVIIPGAATKASEAFLTVSYSKFANREEALQDAQAGRYAWRGFVEFIDGTFPDFRRVIPQKVNPKVQPGLYSASLLGDFADLAKGGFIRVYGDGSEPAFVETGREDCVAVLMPARCPKDYDRGFDSAVTRPAWL
jgi:hypothetical protein